MANPAGQNLDEHQYLWNSDGLLIPDTGALPIRRQRRRLQAARRLGSCAGPQVRHSHRARHSPPGGRRQPAHRRLILPRRPTRPTPPSPCPWDDGNWGIKDNAAGQAYYDSMLKLYAALGPRLPQGRLHHRPPLPPHRDSPDRRSHPQNRPSHRAQPLARPHRARPRSRSREVRPDVAHHRRPLGRLGASRPHSWHELPFGLRDDSTASPQWSPYAGPATGPMPTCSPRASSAHIPAGAKPRQSRLTHDEQRTEFTLWAVAALSPHPRRQSHEARRFHALPHHQPGPLLFMNQNADLQPPRRDCDPRRRL